MMRYLIGVDDTDNPESRGTGNLVRQLAEWFQLDRVAEPRGITRHQLLANRRIPYTAHNTSVCMSLDTENIEAVWETTRDFLALESDPNSNVGLCLGRSDSVSQDVIALGRRAKKKILKLEEAQETAGKSHIRFTGLRGNGGGVIGALAAIGLHRGGNDGRFAWLPGLLELQGKYSVAEIFERTAIDRVCSVNGIELPAETLVDVGAWTRPVLRNGQATLYVEEKKDGWFVLDKQRVKSISS